MSSENTWTGYRLLASGDGRRLEEWDGILTDRPESSALWKKSLSLPEADGIYSGEKALGGTWTWRRPFPSPCIVSRGALTFEIRPTASKHLGLFPEQASNWDWITKRIRTCGPGKTPKILNLFGYTGGATLSAVAAGASATHVDASRAMVTWCSDNARLSGLGGAPIRYIAEDALVFLTREIRRGNRYHGVIMDPPSYGRGSSGELWKLTTRLPELLQKALDVLAENPLFLLLNTYSPPAEDEVEDITAEFLGDQGTLVRDDLTLTGTLDGRTIPCGTVRRWTPASA